MLQLLFEPSPRICDKATVFKTNGGEKQRHHVHVGSSAASSRENSQTNEGHFPLQRLEGPEENKEAKQRPIQCEEVQRTLYAAH